MCIHYIYILIYRVLLFGSVFSKSQHCWEAGGPLPITGRIPPKDMILKSSGPSAPPAHFGSRLRCPCPQTPLLVSSPPSQAGEGEGHGNSNKIKHRGTKVELLPPPSPPRTRQSCQQGEACGGRRRGFPSARRQVLSRGDQVGEGNPVPLSHRCR